MLNEMLSVYRGELGRVMDSTGAVTDYSDTITDKERFSLSRYFDIASYGKLSIQSFITEGYPAHYSFAEIRDSHPDLAFVTPILDWLYKTYPNMDWSKFDNNADGYFDSVILINAGEVGDSYMQFSFCGGIQLTNVYTDELAGTSDRPSFNCYMTVNSHLFDSNVIVHEYGHILGLHDYYDTLGLGIQAVGTFDMQSGNLGDWNPYSKYTVGWIEPEIVADLSSGESVEITIGALATTGDAIVIPTDSELYLGTPFSEYIMIDLFTDLGVNEHDAKKQGLEDVVGVRIYHVNALMEYHELTAEGSDRIYPVGMPHTDNGYDMTGKGNYALELIQAGKDNTFTDLGNLRTNLISDDLFKAGDVFTAENYEEFFYNGKMSDGTEFAYTVTIVKITEGDSPTATIRITKK